jgi:hypothetical protein
VLRLTAVVVLAAIVVLPTAATAQEPRFRANLDLVSVNPGDDGRAVESWSSWIVGAHYPALADDITFGVGGGMQVVPRFGIEGSYRPARYVFTGDLKASGTVGFLFSPFAVTKPTDVLKRAEDYLDLSATFVAHRSPRWQTRVLAGPRIVHVSLDTVSRIFVVSQGSQPPVISRYETRHVSGTKVTLHAGVDEHFALTRRLMLTAGVRVGPGHIVLDEWFRVFSPEYIAPGIPISISRIDLSVGASVRF